MTKKSNLLKISLLVFGCCFLVLLSLCLTGCKEESTQLETPSISYDNGTIRWNTIDKAESYEVVINNNIYNTYNHFYNIPITNISQSFSVRVRSLSTYIKSSDYSETLTFTARKLEEIKNLYIDIDNQTDEIKLTWSKIETNPYYIVKINNTVFKNLTNNNIITKSSNYKTGVNQVSVEVAGTKYDIPSPIQKIIEKSAPLANVNNIRVEDGVLKYGDNEIYDTSHISPGNQTITMSNIESGKIRSDGPSILVKKLNKPLFDYALIGDNNNSVKVRGWFRTEEFDCDWVDIKIFTVDDVCIGYERIGSFSGSIKLFTADIYCNGTDASLYDYVTINSGKLGCLNSNIIKKKIKSLEEISSR